MWCERFSCKLLEMLAHPNVEIFYSVKACMSLNIKETAFLLLVKLQVNLLFTVNPNALLLVINQANFCNHCPFKIANISHLLLDSLVTKTKQIIWHVYICLEFYKAIIKDYCRVTEANIINNPPNCYITDDKNITLTFNKNLANGCYQCPFCSSSCYLH